MRCCALVLVLLLAGCGSAPPSHEFSLAAGDAFDLLRHLQEHATSGGQYYQDRHDEAQKAVDHLNRLASSDKERDAVKSLQEYLAAIEAERGIVDSRQSSVNEMRGLSIRYPYISQCEPPSPVGSPCARMGELKAQVAELNKSILQQDTKTTEARTHVLVE